MRILRFRKQEGAGWLDRWPNDEMGYQASENLAARVLIGNGPKDRSGPAESGVRPSPRPALRLALGRSGGAQLVMQCEQRELETVRDAHLVEDACQVMLDRVLSYREFARDLS